MNLQKNVLLLHRVNIFTHCSNLCFILNLISLPKVSVKTLRVANDLSKLVSKHDAGIWFADMALFANTCTQILHQMKSIVHVLQNRMHSAPGFWRTEETENQLFPLMLRK